jgi:DeoR/GlpR family transcriptional regulator of sugar metabolism
MELSARDGVELLLCGGQVRPGDAACSGAHAEAFFSEFYADKAFLGSGGVHAEAGLTDYYPAEVVVRRTIIEHSASAYVLADSAKLGAIAVHRVCPLDRIAAVITDGSGQSGATDALASAGVTLLRAETRPAPEAAPPTPEAARTPAATPRTHAATKSSRPGPAHPRGEPLRK